MSPAKPVRVEIKTRRGILVLVVAAVLAAPFGGYSLGSQVNDNCASIHKIVQAGSAILDSPRTLKDSLRRGEITQAEYNASIAQINRFDPLRMRNLKRWRSADCKS